jgi:hypothetical protein
LQSFFSGAPHYIRPAPESNNAFMLAGTFVHDTEISAQ